MKKTMSPKAKVEEAVLNCYPENLIQ